MSGVKCFLVALLLPALALAGNTIQSIEVQTHDCSNCGMSFLGDIGLTICRSDNTCCKTGDLDNPFNDDFNAGSISKFEGEYIGECNHFDMFNSSPAQMYVTIKHSGTDGGMFDWVKLYTESRAYQCNFHKVLDNDDSEVSHECSLAQ